jgi:hypothetical protein
MTPEQEKQLKEALELRESLAALKRSVEEISAKIASFENVAFFPFNFQETIIQRIDGTGIVRGDSKGTPDAAVVYNSFPVTVPAAPGSTLKIRWQDTIYELLAK